jgi:diketogulonate reductase-like aldo/keto reductase
MSDNSKIEIGDLQIPALIYGTAWKEERTAELTKLALEAGFRAIDTANQRKHYFEAGVGEGLKKFLQSGRCLREHIFLQSKFTYARGQDHRKPFDDNAPFATQVEQSVASSLIHLDVEYLDSLVLHGPYDSQGIGPEDLEVWAAMEKQFKRRSAHFLGVSNVSPSQLTDLYEQAEIKPTFVQNRCFASRGWDAEVRKICRDRGMVYQGFSLLTANARELAHPTVQAIAQKYQRTVPQIVFRFARRLGIISLTGTSRLEHMQMDLNSFDFELMEAEIGELEAIAGPIEPALMK